MSWRYEDMRDGEKRVLGVVIIVVLIGGVGWLGGVLKRDEPHDTVSPTQDAASPHNSANLNQLLAGLSCRQMKNPEGYLYRTVCESQNFPIVNERTDNSWSLHYGGIATLSRDSIHLADSEFLTRLMLWDKNTEARDCCTSADPQAGLKIFLDNISAREINLYFAPPEWDSPCRKVESQLAANWEYNGEIVPRISMREIQKRWGTLRSPLYKIARQAHGTVCPQSGAIVVDFVLIFSESGKFPPKLLDQIKATGVCGDCSLEAQHYRVTLDPLHPR